MGIKLKVDKTNILYLVLFELEDKPLVKIGVTGRHIEDRMAEIATSVFHQYRYFPYIYPKRFRNVSEAYEKEKILHDHFDGYRYNTIHHFSGCTEFFDIPLSTAVDAYECLLEGKPLVYKEPLQEEEIQVLDESELHFD